MADPAQGLYWIANKPSLMKRGPLAVNNLLNSK